MIIFFITIVFIAEVIIASHLISIIRKCDKKVCEINDAIVPLGSVIEKEISSIRIGINSLALNINKVQIKLTEQKNKYKMILLKHLVSLLLLLTLNFSGKKVAAIFDLGIAINDLLKLVRKSADILEV